jgi:DNA-binding transcriptional regulator YhcF (GntR family)
MPRDSGSGPTKVQQLIDVITKGVTSGKYKEGDALPSINRISADCGLARDTVYKAFQNLKQRGIIASMPTRGYYVAKTVNNVFVLLDIFTPYKDDLYRELTVNLPLTYRLDLYFHQSNERLFTNLIANSLERYDLYIVMNYLNDVYSEVLDLLDVSRVLLIDFGKFEKDKFSYVCQGFDSTLYNCLMSGVELIKKYREMQFIFPIEAEHPISCIPFFSNFCDDINIKHQLVRRPVRESDIVEGSAYLLTRHADVVNFVKTCRSKGLKLGKDVGLIAFNDAPLLEVIEDGITVISTDFKQMGILTAKYIKTRQRVQTYIPTRLIVRGSL